jgi:integral membrane protein
MLPYGLGPTTRAFAMKLFRLVSLIEGFSFLILLFVAMPLRAYMGLAEVVYYVGWIHGILFLAYGALSLAVSHLQRWSIAYWFLVLLLGMVPFGFLVVERHLRRALRPADMPGMA